MGSGFTVKTILTERGRASFLDKMRNLTTKMRGVSRSELPGLLENMIPDLEYFIGIDTLPVLFRNCIKDTITEMTSEIERVKVIFIFIFI